MSKNVRGLEDIAGNGDSSDDEFNEYYAGGEKSGQMIRGAPKDEKDSDKVSSLFDKARKAGAEVGTAADLDPQAQAEPQAFRGAGRTLAGGSVQPPAQAPAPDAPVNHVITFYSNGVFTVDDGPPRAVDDPANDEFMSSISNRECPRELDPGNSSVPVTVNLVRKEEEYKEPEKAKYVPFSGSGRTLSAGPSPSAAGGGASTSTAPAPASAGPPPISSDPSGQWEGVNESQPTTSIQLRLADGSRMVVRLNHTHTIGDLRRFIRASHPTGPDTYQLMTAFPSQPLEDMSRTIEEAGLLNAVIIQKK